MEEIHTLNQQLLKHVTSHLEEIIRSKGNVVDSHRVGAIFSSFAPLFKLYTNYASHYDDALKVSYVDIWWQQSQREGRAMQIGRGHMFIEGK